MANNNNRLRLHPAAVLALLLFASGGAAVTFISDRDEEVPADSEQWSAWETVDDIIATSLLGDSVQVVHLHDEAIELHQGVAAFYEARNFSPAWREPAVRDTLTHALRDLWTVGLDPDRYFATTLTDMARNTMPNLEGADTTLAELDLLLTHAAFTLADDVSRPQVDVADLYGSRWFAHERPHDVAGELQAALSSSATADSVAVAMERLHPTHPDFLALRAAYIRHREMLEMKDWPIILPGRTLVPGDTSALVPTLRYRMSLEGFFLPEPDSTEQNVYNEALVAAVVAFQESKDLEADSTVGQPTRAALNMRPEDQSALFRLNLERWRWLPEDFGDFHVITNIPAFELAVRKRDGDGFAELLRMSTVVGKHNWETPVFSDTMTQVIFNPTWTIPRSIQMESYGEYRGLVVQQPGPSNPMRRVKFRFPNDLGIYIHDTNSQWPFGQERRAYSHGCIRAAAPQELAETILAETNAWIPEQVGDIFGGPWIQQPVEMEAPVPVHIVYFTAWVNPDGHLSLYDDVYGYDRSLAAAMGIAL